MKAERRKTRRHRLEDEIFHVMDRCSEKIATVRDMSTKGMQIRYSPEGRVCHQWSLVDIVAADRNQVIIPDLACRPVYDIASLLEDGSFSGAYVRTCGVCFERLDDNQRLRLARLFESIAPAESPTVGPTDNQDSNSTMARTKGGPECKGIRQ